VIEFRSVSKNYGEVRALNDVSFSLHPGEVFGYIGPNGAGKTTTLRALTGLVAGYGGTILLDGSDIENGREDLHRRLGYLPQDSGFQEWRTAAGALTTLGRLSGVDPAKLGRRVNAVLDLLGIREYADRKVAKLSGGTRQKLLFAQAILHDPEILILDEPLSGLDPASRFQMKEIVRAAAADGRTVLLSSHVLADVEDLADRIAIINRGSIAAAGTPAELRAEHGSDNVVEVSVSGGIADVEELLRSVPTPATLHDPDSSTRRYTFSDDEDATRAMKVLLTSLGSASCNVRSIRRVDPSLEEIYIELTRSER
jgi:ABC-2 type transport system ATP-binding protein